MSGDQAFYSFANYLKETLAGNGLNVYIGERGDKIAPFLNLQILGDDPKGWISRQMCQAWLVVETDQDLGVAASRYMDLVLAATRDDGTIAKFDYKQEPKKSAGSLSYRTTGVTGNMSSDPQRSKRVITWILTSNSAM